jgi:hypothetical protein
MQFLTRGPDVGLAESGFALSPRTPGDATSLQFSSRVIGGLCQLHRECKEFRRLAKEE